MPAGNILAVNPHGFDLTHIVGVCDDAFTTIRPHAYPPEVRIFRAMPGVLAPDETHQLAALHALRRVGYLANAPREPHTGPSTGLPYERRAVHDEDAVHWVRVRGWDSAALNRRLDELTATAHQLVADLPLNIGRAIETFAVAADQSGLGTPGYKASAQIRAQLREQVRQTTGPHVPYDPDILPTHSKLADLLKRVRGQEHRVDDLISRTWLYAADAIQSYRGHRRRYRPALAHDRALIDALNSATELAKRDTIITIMQWARDQGHGDAIAYAHWYAHTYGTFRDGPAPATAYDAWRDHAAVQHPAAVAAHDHPTGIPGELHSSEHTIDPGYNHAQNQTHVRNVLQSGRRAS